MKKIKATLVFVIIAVMLSLSVVPAYATAYSVYILMASGYRLPDAQ